MASHKKAKRRDWIGLGIIALPCVLYSMDLTVLNLAVPSLTQELKPSSTQLLWILDIYGFMVAGCLITMGTLGDRIGRRKLLLIGAAAFGFTSVLAAFSKTASMLIATRALLGIAGATLAPSTLSLIRNMFFNPRERSLAIGVWISSYSIGGAIGPLLGGLVLERFRWGAVFLVAVPVMILLLILGPLLIPEYKNPKAGAPDLISPGLSMGSVLSVIYGLKQTAALGVNASSAAVILLGLLLGWAFCRRQMRLKDPMIDLNLFRFRKFNVSLAIYLLTSLISFGFFLFIGQYLQLVQGLSPLVAGIWTLPWTIGFIGASLLTPSINRRFSPAITMALGLAVSAAGFAFLSQIQVNSGVGLFVLGTVLLSGGMAPVITLAIDLIVGTAPPERAGAASAISETCAELGGALGIALLGSIGAALYRLSLPTNLPEAARATLGGALRIAQALPSPQAEHLTETARQAFMKSMEMTSALCAMATVATAVLALAFLHKLPKTPPPSH